MLSKRQIFENASESMLIVQSRASERLQDQIVEEMKEMEQKATEALELVRKENDLWEYQNEKEEAKILQGARKLRKDEEMAWAPPRNMSKWPDWEEARRMEESEWRLEPQGETEVPEIIVVSDVVESTFVDLDGESRRAEAKLSRREREREWHQAKGVRRLKSPKRKSDSGGIRGNAGLCKRGKECGAGRSGREDLRTERGKRSAKAFVSL